MKLLVITLVLVCSCCNRLILLIQKNVKVNILSLKFSHLQKIKVQEQFLVLLFGYSTFFSNVKTGTFWVKSTFTHTTYRCAIRGKTGKTLILQNRTQPPGFWFFFNCPGCQIFILCEIHILVKLELNQIQLKTFFLLVVSPPDHNTLIYPLPPSIFQLSASSDGPIQN